MNLPSLVISTTNASGRRNAWLLGLLLMGLVPLHPAQAQRPPSTKLFPKATLAYLSVPDVQALAERFKQTSLGLMAQDAQMKPLVDQVYAAILASAQPLEENLGVSLSELLALPNGELALGFVVPTESPPALLALLDTGENVAALQRLLDRADRALVEGAPRVKPKKPAASRSRSTRSTRRARTRQVVYLQKEGTLILGTDLSAVQDLLARWKDGSLPSLADNQQFAGIKYNVTSGAEKPQLNFFVDPINFVKEMGRGNTSATLAIALFPSLGLDGLQGIGGSLAFAEGQFDGINRFFVSLNNPRKGVVELVALSTGDVTPENWVPAQAATYTTLHWDVQKTFKKLGVLIDSFQGEGAFKAQVQQRVPAGVELDVERELIPLFAGRVTYITQIEEPITPRSQMQLLGVKLVDGKRAQGVFDRISRAFDDVIERKNYVGKAYLKYRPVGAAEDAQERGGPPPCFAILGDYLLIGREALLEKAFLATTDASKSLGQSLDFKLIASKAQRQAGGNRPSMFSFHRPEEALRFMYGLATADSTRQGLERRGETNPFMKDLNKALNENPPPPLSVLQKYVAPGGTVMVSDETGIRYTSFTLRRMEE